MAAFDITLSLLSFIIIFISLIVYYIATLSTAEYGRYIRYFRYYFITSIFLFGIRNNYFFTTNSRKYFATDAWWQRMLPYSWVPSLSFLKRDTLYFDCSLSILAFCFLMFSIIYAFTHADWLLRWGYFRCKQHGHWVISGAYLTAAAACIDFFCLNITADN